MSSSSSESMDIESPLIKPGDEICAYDHQSGYVVCGVAQYKECSTKEWSVRWVNDSNLTMPKYISEGRIKLIDRGVNRGSKVRSLTDLENEEMKVGKCRSIMCFADLRIVGTNTVISGVDVLEFTNLKDYKEQSVVHYNGWLGIITNVNRIALVVTPTANESKWLPLRDVIPVSLMARESPFIHEVTPKGACLIRDLKIQSVTVDWCHQFDMDFADKPRQTFTKDSHVRLHLVAPTELLELGSLGRYEMKETTKLRSLEEWQHALAQEFYPEVVGDASPTNFGENSSALNASGRNYDVDNFAARLASNDLKTGDSLVVEVLRLSRTLDVMWKEDDTEFISSLQVEPINYNRILPNDFLYIKLLKHELDEAFSVMIEESQIENDKYFTVRVLDAHIPGKVIEDSKFFTNNPRSNIMKRHPIYRYFNEMNTIVVVNEVEGIRVGHVNCASRSGKVNVTFSDTGREEWLWPQSCAIYTIKGYDLECIRSHVTDTTEIEPEIKLRNILELFNQKIAMIWQNDLTTENDLRESLRHFEKLHCSYQNVLSRISEERQLITVQSESYSELKLCIQQFCDSGENYVLQSNATISQLVLNAVKDIIQLGEKILNPLMPVSEPMEVHKCGSSSEATDEKELRDIFSQTVAYESLHPLNHHYATSSNNDKLYDEKTIEEEFATLSDKSVLVRGFWSKYDLFSVLIRGTSHTPYEDSVYLFDICLPSKCRFTASQNFHFNNFNAGDLNPYLYEGGTVHTVWKKKSKLIQVIQSMQASIFIKEPFSNKPNKKADKSSISEANQNNLGYNQKLMPNIIEMMINQITFGLEPWQKIMLIFYKHQIPTFIARWRKWLAVTSEDALSAIERPGFEIYPMEQSFVSTMTASIVRLEALWTQKLSNFMIFQP